jgi:8-oxo-dGTP pyrophosphatase MutT (NUDIX family)
VAPVTVREAATLILVRDVRSLSGIEVFLLRRNPNSAFVPSASVFPGGAVDPADADISVAGRADADCDRLLARPQARRWWVAAAREAFEEAGILLSAPAPAPDLVDGALVEARRELNAGRRDFASVLAEHDLAVDAGALHVLAHWLTPVGAPRRYDTWFFCAAAPTGQDGLHDNAETVHSEWVTPRDALDRHDAGELELIEPTRRTLLALSQFDRAADLLAAVRALETESRDADRAPLVVAESQGERIALLADDPRPAAGARRGWRDLSVEPGVTDPVGSRQEGAA